MEEEMKLKVLDQLKLVESENKLFCNHDLEKACEKCLSKISNYEQLSGNCSGLRGNCLGLSGDCSEIKRILKKRLAVEEELKGLEKKLKAALR